MITNFQLKHRIATEKRIVRQVIKDAFKAGYILAIDNGCDYGEEVIVKASDGISKAMTEVMLSDEDRVYLIKPENFKSQKTWKHSGWVYFVYGNDGWDVISDYTINLEDLLKASIRLSERLSA